MKRTVAIRPIDWSLEKLRVVFLKPLFNEHMRIFAANACMKPTSNNGALLIANSPQRNRFYVKHPSDNLKVRQSTMLHLDKMTGKKD
jgi:hypothetical protein